MNINYLEEKSYRGGTTIRIYTTEAANPQAQFAQELMRHLAIIAGVPDGEDTHGRQKVRLMTEPEVVARATEIAALTWAEFAKRDWFLTLPAPKPSEEKP